MNIRVEYTAQLRVASNTPEECYDLAADACFRNLLEAIQERHGEPLVSQLLDQEKQLHRWILADRAGAIVREPMTELKDGDTIRLMSPISGG